MWAQQTYPSGYGARLLSECALHAQVRTLPSAAFCYGGENVTSDGIEPPLSDLESEVLPLHHEAADRAARPSRGNKTHILPRGFEPRSQDSES